LGVEERVEEMRRAFEEEIAEELAQEPDLTKRILTFLSWLNEYLEAQGLGRLILVGGFAVEVYTGSTYRTLDVDIVVTGGAGLVRSFLDAIADRTGRTWVPRLRPLAKKGIDLVGTVLTGEKRPVELRIRGRRLYVEAPEDLIVKSLAGWKFWNSEEDRDKAILLLEALRGRIDLDYLRRRAREEGVLDKLEEAEGVA